MALRGNHDDKSFFVDNEFQEDKNIYLVPDYTVVNVCGKNILCIGGGISVDRVFRQKQDSHKIVKFMKFTNATYKEAEKMCPKTYWTDEPVEYKMRVLEKVDILTTHTAPSFCYPFDKGQIVREYSIYDKNLVDDIFQERHYMDMIFNDYKDQITHWYYGHFHQSYTEIINDIQFKLLNIDEFARFTASSDIDDSL